MGHFLNIFVIRSSSGVNPSSFRSVDVDIRGDARLWRVDSATDGDLELGVPVAASAAAAVAAARCENEPPAAEPTATFGVTNAWPTEHTLVANAADNNAARAIIVEYLHSCRTLVVSGSSSARVYYCDVSSQQQLQVGVERAERYPRTPLSSYIMRKGWGGGGHHWFNTADC